MQLGLKQKRRDLSLKGGMWSDVLFTY